MLFLSFCCLCAYINKRDFLSSINIQYSYYSIQFTSRTVKQVTTSLKESQFFTRLELLLQASIQTYHFKYKTKMIGFANLIQNFSGNGRFADNPGDLLKQEDQSQFIKYFIKNTWLKCTTGCDSKEKRQIFLSEHIHRIIRLIQYIYSFHPLTFRHCHNAFSFLYY